MIGGAGVPLTEFILESVIRNGLIRIRANPAILNEIFESFLDPYLVATYGTDTLENIKNYVLGTNFHVVQGWPNESTKTPCCSINILSSDELPGRAALSDDVETIESAADPRIVIDLFQPTSYDSASGFLTVSSSLNIDSVIAGHIFVDCADNAFTISAIINTATVKKIAIGANETVSIGSSECFIKGTINTNITEKKQIPLQEKIVLGIHAADEPKACKYFYMIILYILASSRDIFENLGLQIHNTNISDFSRVTEYLPETWFSRFINLSFLTWMNWTSGITTTDGSAETVIRIDKDTLVVPITSFKPVITTE